MILMKWPQKSWPIFVLIIWITLRIFNSIINSSSKWRSHRILQILLNLSFICPLIQMFHFLILPFLLIKIYLSRETSHLYMFFLILRLSVEQTWTFKRELAIIWCRRFGSANVFFHLIRKVIKCCIILFFDRITQKLSLIRQVS